MRQRQPTFKSIQKIVWPFARAKNSNIFILEQKKFSNMCCSFLDDPTTVCRSSQKHKDSYSIHWTTEPEAPQPGDLSSVSGPPRQDNRLQ